MPPLSDELRVLADDIWTAQHEHPFVLGIGDGSVDREQFQFWVKQDYLFLIEYARLFAIATARAPSLELMRRFADLTQNTLSTEMELHRAYAADFGISAEELEAGVKAPTTQAYTDFLLRTASIGDFTSLVAALLPCMWGFCEIGLALRERGLPDDPLCVRWIEMYSSPEFVELTQWCRDVLDGLTDELTVDEREPLGEVFLTSSRYELRFWQMASTLEAWEL